MKIQYKKIILWSLQIIPALILLQTLFFKFTGAQESVEIFTRLGVEPWGRYATGILELIAGVALLSGRFSLIGAIITSIIMLGAILSHIFVLGINDLFYLALLVLACSLGVIWMKVKNLKHNKK